MAGAVLPPPGIRFPPGTAARATAGAGVQKGERMSGAVAVLPPPGIRFPPGTAARATAVAGVQKGERMSAAVAMAVKAGAVMVAAGAC